VSIYVAGLLGLAIAIRLRLTNDIATAWYAVTLLPRTDVAGQGVTIWLTWPLPIVVVLLVLDTVAEHFGVSNTDMIDNLVLLPGLILLAIFSVLALRYLNKINKESPEWTSERKFIVATPLIAATGSLLISEGSLLIVRAAREADIPVLQVLTHGEFFGPIVFLVGGFLVGVAGAVVIENPLPQVQIDSDPTLSPPAFLAKDQLYLVTHSEGHWHLLDDDENELLSVPDRLVLTVHTIPKKT
jgi:hypothetical protein